MAARKSNNQTNVPSWVWLFTSAMLGAFVMFLLQLSVIEPDQAITHDGGAQQSSPDSTKDKKRNFDFYKLLKESEVPVDENVAKDYQPTGDPNAPQKEYLLQVASFSNLEDAEQTRAELILLNLNARIEEANLRKGEKWHRVIVGPFENRSQFAKARSTLISNRYEAMVLTRPKS